MFSAHPPRYGTWLIWILLAALSLAMAWAWFGEIDYVVKANGVLRPQANLSTVRNIISGKVKTVNLREGDQVSQGDVLLIIDTELIDSKLKSLTAELSDLEGQLSELKQLRALMIEAAQASDGDQPGPSCLDDTKTAYHRYIVFMTQYNQLLLALRRAEANLEKHKRSSVLPEHELLLLELEQEAARLSLDNYLHTAVAAVDQEICTKAERVNSVQVQMTELENAKQQSCITAPISGTVQLIHQINSGEYLPAGHELARIVPVEEHAFCVEISVRNQDIALIDAGQAVVYRFEALPRHLYGTISGHITGIAGDAVFVGGSLVYRAFGSVEQTVIQDRHGNQAELKPGMICEVLVITKRDKILYWLLQKLGLLN